MRGVARFCTVAPWDLGLAEAYVDAGPANLLEDVMTEQDGDSEILLLAMKRNACVRANDSLWVEKSLFVLWLR